MNTADLTSTPRYLDAFESVVRDEPVWLTERRLLAIERFSLLGFPTTKHEEYKYTNLSKIARGEWRPGRPAARRRRKRWPKPLRGAERSAPRLVFVDGRFDAAPPSPSRCRRWSRSGQLLEAAFDALEGHLTRYADFEDHALTALNTAFFEDGAVIRVAERAVIAEPIQIIFIASGEAGTVSWPRVLIHAARQSQVQVIETFVSAADGAHWSNSVTEIVAEEAARVEHFQVQQESLEAFHTGRVEMIEERTSAISRRSRSPLAMR